MVGELLNEILFEFAKVLHSADPVREEVSQRVLVVDSNSFCHFVAQSWILLNQKLVVFDRQRGNSAVVLADY